MKQKPAKAQFQKVKVQPVAKAPPVPDLRWRRRNYILLAVGVGTIAAGFVTLAMGSTTLAPLLLVLGYCVLIPLGLLLK